MKRRKRSLKYGPLPVWPLKAIEFIQKSIVIGDRVFACIFLSVVDSRCERNGMHRDKQVPAKHQLAVGLQPRFEFVRGIVLAEAKIARIASLNEVEDNNPLFGRDEQCVNWMASLRGPNNRIANEKLPFKFRKLRKVRGERLARRGLVIRSSYDCDRRIHALSSLACETTFTFRSNRMFTCDERAILNFALIVGTANWSFGLGDECCLREPTRTRLKSGPPICGVGVIEAMAYRWQRCAESSCRRVCGNGIQQNDHIVHCSTRANEV